MEHNAVNTTTEAVKASGAAPHAGEHGGAIGESAMEFCKVHFLGGMLHLDTVVYSVAIVLLLIVLAIITKRHIKTIPTAIQSLFEIIYDWLGGLAEDMIGKNGREYVPFVMTIFLFIICANWISMIPIFIPPTRDINATAAYALISFMGFMYFGIAKAFKDIKKEKNATGFNLLTQGFWKWFSHYFEPVPSLWNDLEGALKYILCPFLFVLFFILNVIEELARVLSLSIRLMGNVMGEHMALAVFLGLVVAAGKIDFVMGSAKVLIWFSSAFVVVLGALTGFIQAMIFAVLTLSYIAHAVAEEH